LPKTNIFCESQNLLLLLNMWNIFFT
jgi:hypothetical protein